MKSLRLLRELLGNGRESVVPSQIRRADQQRLLDSRRQQHETSEASTQVSQEEESKLVELQRKLRDADTAVRKERALRKSMERAFEDLTAHRKILTEELEKSNAVQKSLQEEISLLRKEKMLEINAFKDERKKHLEEMDNLHQQKQSALSQRDSMEARMLGSEKLAAELKAELVKIKDELLKEQERNHESLTTESSKHLKKELDESQVKIQALTNEVRQLAARIEGHPV